MEGVEEKLDYIISIEPKRHKELLAAIGQREPPPQVHVDLSEVIQSNKDLVQKVKEIVAGNSGAAALGDLTAAIKENNKLLSALAAKQAAPPQKKEYNFEIKRNKFTDLIESISAKEK